MTTRLLKACSLLVSIVFLSSCASSYRSIHPERITFSAKSESNNVVLQYKHAVLAEHGNKKYVKKERDNYVQVVAVNLTNNSDQTIDVANDVTFYSGTNAFTPLDPIIAHANLKQGVPIYLLYMLLSPAKVTSENYVNGVRTESSSFPIGVFLGPGITLFNVARASSANNNLLQNLEKYNIVNKQIKPGETISGLVVVPNSSYNPLHIKVGPADVQARQ